MKSWRNRLILPAVLAIAVTTGLTVAPPVPQRATASTTVPGTGWLSGRSSTTLVNNIEDAEVTVAPLTPLSFVLNAGGSTARRVQITANIRVQATLPSTVNAYLDIYPAGSPGSAQRIAGSTTYLPNTGGAGSETMVVTGTTFLSTGPTYTVELVVKRAVGNGVVAVSSTSGTPQQVWVEDLGA